MIAKIGLLIRRIAKITMGAGCVFVLILWARASSLRPDPDHITMGKWQERSGMPVNLQLCVYSNDGRIGFWILRQWAFTEREYFGFSPPIEFPSYLPKHLTKSWQWGHEAVGWSQVPGIMRPQASGWGPVRWDEFEMWAPQYHFARSEVGISHWFVALVLGCWPLLSLVIGFSHRRKRRGIGKQGLCQNCGYDLRESKLRCPECGTPVEERRINSTMVDCEGANERG